MNRIQLYYLISTLSLLFILSCNTKKQEESNDTESTQEKINISVSVIEIVSPKPESLFAVGDEIDIYRPIPFVVAVYCPAAD